MAFCSSLLSYGPLLIVFFPQMRVKQVAAECQPVNIFMSVHTQFPAIHLLEALAIIGELRQWGRHWHGLRIVIYCDNLSVVSSLNSGHVQDPLLGSSLREIWFLTAIHKFKLRTCHLTSSDNHGADLLSRLHLLHTFQDKFPLSFGALGLRQVSVPEDFFQLSDTF